MKKNLIRKKFILHLILLFVLSSVVLFYQQSPSAYAQSNWPEIGALIKLEKGYPYASSVELFKKALDIISSGDKEAFFQLMLTGEVGITDSGDMAYYHGMEGGGWLPSGIVKIRFKGSTKYYYTNCEAVGIK